MQLHNLKNDIQSSVLKSVRRLTYAFVPQLPRTRIFDDPSPPSRIYPTSWLDGLRGLAALCVFNFHYLFAYGDMASKPWGDSKHRWLVELPIIRLPYLGLPMVNIFFIVAGYVISLKPLQLMHSNTSVSREKLLQTICSSVFRRFFRLYLPVVASTMLIVIATRLYLLEITRGPLVDRKIFPGTREKHLERLDTLSNQLLFWCKEMARLTSVWEWKPFYPLHDQHLWTIQYEFRSSLVLYLCLILVARARIYVKLTMLLALSFYALCSDRYEIMLYLWGSCLAQWDVIRESNPDEQTLLLVDTGKGFDEGSMVEAPSLMSQSSNLTRAQKYLRRLFNGAAVLLCLWLLTSPTTGYKTAYGYETLSHLIPAFWTRKEKFLPALGSALLLWLLSHSSPASLIQRTLTSHPAQYLGKISFSLYLMHGPVLHIYGYMVPIWVWRVVDRERVVGFCAGLGVGWICNLLVVLWVADVFNREVDGRCVKITKWIEGMCFVK